MTPRSSCGDAVAFWAQRTSEIKAAVLIGSRAQAASAGTSLADAASDWDFHLIVRQPANFARSDWTRAAGLSPFRAYVVRKTLWGGGIKVNVALADVEADVMIFPYSRVRRLQWMTLAGFHRRAGWTRRSLQALGDHVRPGWRFIKGAGWLEPLYRRAAAAPPDERLDDDDVRRLAAGFACDYLWTVRKIGQGELLAAQRMLHRELAEVNFRLLHELRLRRGERTFWQARRVERVASPRELAAVTVSALCEPQSLRAAVEHASSSCEDGVRQLLGVNWICPRVAPSAAPCDANGERG